MSGDDLEGVWKALADRTRRDLLDALRDGPKTTGELCRPFRLSRFAVMKHLAVLEAAGLVLVRRQGRERWNHLNAAPIRQVYERWVRPYEGQWADRLLRLKDQSEHPDQGDPMGAKADFGVAQVELEVPIKARPARVWQALVGETSRWWLKDFYTSPAAKGFVIEPKLGGRVYEDWGDGAGQVWYTVIGLDPQKSLLLLGHLTPAFGGPATTMLRLDLAAAGKGTRLGLSDTIFGRVGDEKLTQTRQGWTMLFDGGLKAYVEAA
jgi:DNA-binding transcriptional ArsR family regulator